MHVRILGAVLAVALLAACSSTDKDAGSRSATGGGTGSPFAAGGKVFFDLDSAVIRGDGRPVLDAQADWLTRNPAVNVQIAGNCDERGTEEYNLALGSRRAYAASTYLAAKGVTSSRVSTISYGKDRPIAPGSTEDAWAQNRNATTTVR